jgi:biotin carboxylase
MKSLKKILIIGAGIMQVPIIKKCKKLGYKTVITDVNKNAPGMCLADIALAIDTLDKDSTLKAARKYKIDGVITTSDYPVRTLAYLCRKLKLNGISEDAAEKCTNKYFLRESLRKNKINCPKYWRAKTLRELNLIKKELFYPLIVKPVDSSASRGVLKVSNYSKLKKAFKSAKKYSKCGIVIIEEFLEGSEYSVESLTQSGKTVIVAITEKTVSPSRSYFVEDRHIISANITKKNEDRIKSLVKQAIKAIKLNNCATHTELKLTFRGPIIIEIGARLGGDYITSDLVPLSTGVDMLKNIINISIGRKINTKKTRSKYAGIQFINSRNYYQVKKHLKKIRLDEGLINSKLEKYKRITLKSSLDRLGYFICVGNSRKQLMKLLNYK